MDKLIIIGGGLAGSEACWQAANQGIDVTLFEMRPQKNTGAHKTALLGELVCSNSLGSKLVDRSSGLLKEELRMSGSLLVKIAEQNAVPAGNSLSVDRTNFAVSVTEMLEKHPRIQLVREEITKIPDTEAIIATGPLTSARLSEEIEKITGKENLYFFDAIAPIIAADSIDMEIAFKASRYDKGSLNDGDYINCPFNQSEYEAFVEALVSAERIKLQVFEKDLNKGVKAGSHQYFERCLPVEVLANRGKNTLAFGPMKPVGLQDPRTGNRPYAVIQLRQDNFSGSMYNMVGFQTNLTYPAQKAVFRRIPGLKHAEFIRYGQMHRNTFIASPALLDPSMQFRNNRKLFFAGQITGIEGYLGNIASGLIAGINAARYLKGKELLEFPETTMIGSMSRNIARTPLKDFQPMKSNFGIIPGLQSPINNKLKRYQAYSDRSLSDLFAFLQENEITTI